MQRCKTKVMLTSADHEAILDAAFQIIDSSTDNDALFNEACSLPKKMKLDGRTKKLEGSVESMLSVTCEGPRSNDGQGLFTAPILAKQVIELAHVCQDEDRLLSHSNLDKFEVILRLLKSRPDDVVSGKLFISMVERHELPLEMVWNLHKIGVLSLEIYFSHHLEDRDFKAKMLKDLGSLSDGTMETLNRRQELLSGFVLFLIKKGYGDGKATDKKVAVQMLDDVLQGVLELNGTGPEAVSLALPTDFLKLGVDVARETLRKFCIHALSMVLSHGVNMSVSECLQSGKDWKTVHVNTVEKILIKQLFLPLEFKDVTGILMRHVDQTRINGTSVLIFLFVMYLTFPETAKFLIAHIKSELTNGLERTDKEKLSAGLLLVRQSAVVGQHHQFPSYSEWFQSVFDGTHQSPATTRPTFTCLVNFLSSLVPHELAEYLKVHIVKRPHIPPKCRDLYDDYIALAKTRLHDLKVPLCDIWDGIYDGDNDANSRNDGYRNEGSLDPAERDVEKALESFAETRKIPTALLEASIFRRPYFMGKFLPALLKPRHLPDEPDLRMMLIEEIKNSGRIPPAVYKRYLEDCEKEKQALLEGVFDVDDEDEVEEMILSPSDQLTRSLGKFCDTICHGPEEKILECLHRVLERIESLVLPSKTPQAIEASVCSSVCVDLIKPLEENPSMKVVVTVIGHLSFLIDRWMEHTQCQSDRGKVVRGALKLIAMVTQQFPCLVQVICSCTLSKLTKQKWAPETPGLAAACVGIMASPHLCKLQVTVKHKHGASGVQSCTFENIATALLHCSLPSIGQGQKFMLRFWLVYVNIALGLVDAEERLVADAEVIEVGTENITIDQLIPDSVVKRVNLLCRRFGLLPQNRKPGVSDTWQSALYPIIQTTLANNKWKSLCLKHQLFLLDWIEFELTVDPTRDYLSFSERFTSMWEFSSYFLSKYQQQDKVSGFCGELFTSLGNYMTLTSRSQDDFQPKSTTSIASFLQLLRQHLLQLPPCKSNDASWLTKTLGSSSIPIHKKDTLLRLMMDLPPYLMFCNSPHENIDKRHVDCAMTILNALGKSVYSRGTGLAMDATVYCLQAYIHAKHKATRVLDLQPFEVHPLVSISVLEHKETLEELGLFAELRETWTTTLITALQWAQRILEVGKECVEEKPQSSWLGGAALFVFLLNREGSELVDDALFLQLVSIDEKTVLHLLEMILIHLTMRGLWNSDPQQTQENVLVKTFHLIVGRNANLLYHLLDPACIDLSEFRCQLGMDNEHHRTVFKDLCLLRLSMQIPGPQLVKNTTENITCAVVSVYKRCLLHARDNGMKQPEFYEEICQDSLIKWIKTMVDSTSKVSLQRIELPPAGSVDDEVILFRYIEEKKKGWV